MGSTESLATAVTVRTNIALLEMKVGVSNHQLGLRISEYNVSPKGWRTFPGLEIGRFQGNVHISVGVQEDGHSGSGIAGSMCYVALNRIDSLMNKLFKK